MDLVELIMHNTVSFKFIWFLWFYIFNGCAMGADYFFQLFLLLQNTNATVYKSHHWFLICITHFWFLSENWGGWGWKGKRCRLSLLNRSMQLLIICLIQFILLFFLEKKSFITKRIKLITRLMWAGSNYWSYGCDSHAGIANLLNLSIFNFSF